MTGMLPSSIRAQTSAPSAAMRGKAVYDQNCANCHGPAGAGGVANTGAASPADKKIPPLVGSAFTQKFPATDSIRKIIENGSNVRGGADVINMPGWNGVLTEAQIDDLVAYIESLQRTVISAAKLAAVGVIWTLVLTASGLLYVRLGQVKREEEAG